MAEGGKRILWVDAWKGVLIVCVILGHVVGAGYHFASGCNQIILQEVYRIIYSFHMPAFFFLAGMMWRRHDNGFASYARGKAFRLLVPYAVFGCLSIVVYLFATTAFSSMFGPSTTGAYEGKGQELWWQPFLYLLHAGGWPGGDGFQANSVLWFLPCMFTLEILYYWVDRFVPGRMGQLVLAVVLLLASTRLSQDPLRWLPWGVSRVPHYMFYFIVGRWCKFKSLLEWMTKDVRVSLGIVVAGFSGMAYACYALPDADCALRCYGWRLVFSLLALEGVLVSAVLANLIQDVPFLQQFGAFSLVIMLLHKFVVLALQFGVSPLRDMFARSVFATMFASVVITGVAAFLCLMAGVMLRKFFPWVIGEKRR